MEKPRIRHIAINVEDLDKTAEYYKKVFGMEEKHRPPGELFTCPMAISISLSSTRTNIPGAFITLVSKSIASKTSRRLPTPKLKTTPMGPLLKAGSKTSKAIASMFPSMAGQSRAC